MDTTQVQDPTTTPIEPTPASRLGLIREALLQVDELRRLSAATSAVLKERRTAFDVENAGTVLTLRDVELRREAAESALRALALAHHKATGETKPTAGVEITTRNVLTIRDPAAALAWAKKSEMCLIPESVDEDALKKVAKATPLPFVDYTTVSAVRISSDLEKVLGGAA